MNIKDIDFAQNKPEINDALIKLQAMANLAEISENVCSKLVSRLMEEQNQQNEAVEAIEDLENNQIYPFCEQYLQEIIRLREEKNQGNSFHLKRTLRFINRRKIGRTVFQIKDNQEFTAEKAKEIANAAKKDSFSQINIEISQTKGLDKKAVGVLRDCPNVQFCYLGKHPYQTHNLEELFSPEKLSKCLTNIERIEENINPQWSNTSKALYIFRNLYHSCKYGSGSSMSSVFLEKDSICQGFAVAYKEMMQRQGINCRICLSEEGSHLFNEVKLNNKWVPVDLSDAADWHKAVNLSPDIIDAIDFGGSRFISHLSEKQQEHHRSMGRYMKAGSDNISCLTKEEYSAALAEISSSEKKNGYGKMLKKDDKSRN